MAKSDPVAALDRDHAGTGLDMAACGFEPLAKSAGDGSKVDDARVGRMKRGDPSHMRFELAQAGRVESPQPLHTVRDAAALQLVEARELPGVGGHDHLAAPLGLDSVG